MKYFYTRIERFYNFFSNLVAFIALKLDENALTSQGLLWLLWNFVQWISSPCFTLNWYRCCHKNSGSRFRLFEKSAPHTHTGNNKFLTLKAIISRVKKLGAPVHDGLNSMQSLYSTVAHQICSKIHFFYNLSGFAPIVLKLCPMNF